MATNVGSIDEGDQVQNQEHRYKPVVYLANDSFVLLFREVDKELGIVI